MKYIIMISTLFSLLYQTNIHTAGHKKKAAYCLGRYLTSYCLPQKTNFAPYNHHLRQFPGETVAHMAIRSEDSEYVKFLVRNYPYLVQAHTNLGYNLLHYSIIMENNDLVHFFTKNHPDLALSITNFGDTALSLAQERNLDLIINIIDEKITKE